MLGDLLSLVLLVNRISEGDRVMLFQGFLQGWRVLSAFDCDPIHILEKFMSPDLLERDAFFRVFLEQSE